MYGYEWKVASEIPSETRWTELNIYLTLTNTLASITRTPSTPFTVRSGFKTPVPESLADNAVVPVGCQQETVEISIRREPVFSDGGR